MPDPTAAPPHRWPTLRRWLGACAFAAALATMSTAAVAVDEDDLLPVDEAFVLSARAAGPERIEVRWRIADGYYLYRHRTSVTASGFNAAALQLPPGKAYKDEFFGDVETYRGQLVATLAGQPTGARATLTVKYQGCADAGVCYPPQTRTLDVALPAGAAASNTLLPGGAASGGNALLGGGTPVGVDALPLPPEQAFGFEAIADGGDRLLLRFTPAPGYYLYRDKTTLAIEGETAGREGIRPGALQWPAGVRHKDEYFGTTTVFFDQIDVPLPLRRDGAGGGPIRVVAGFQGCQSDGICYPPMTRTVSLELPAGTVTAAAPEVESDAPVSPDAQAATAEVVDAGSKAPAASEAAGAGAASGATATTEDRPDAPVAPESAAGADAATAPLAEDSRLAAALAGPHRAWALLVFFGLGLGLAFTPCVLPMIPILSGLIAGHGPGLGARRAAALSLVYVLANALVFTAAGVLAGLAGANLQIAFQTPWVIVAFALLFVALALSSFGLYELQLPAGLRSRLGEVADRQRGGSWSGVAIMGALSALIVGPCVAPPLAGAVLYIGQTQDPVFGGAALFALAMGMGAPLVAFGVAAGRGLPTSGPWMVAIQRAFGFVFLGLAVWMLSRILPAPATLALWGVLLLGAAATVGVVIVGKAALHPGRRAVLATLALLLGVAGGAQLVGAMAGGRDPLQPLAGLGSGPAQAAELPFRKIKSTDDLDAAIAAAAQAGQPLMLDFYADWCVACKEMEKYTFPEREVHDALDGFVLVKADVTANDELDQALMKRLGIIGPPATLYFVEGRERRDLRLFGFEKAPAFAERARRAQSPAAAAGSP
ncbi:protein-disulfide reductase DsbD [Novilysobacter selenitireducens]|uniref:Thiol:disulfide interchange protein DsbD n=1 Tax=Novilysobacter selenitireducens TaxID=2872639 RepID=A0ABS7T9L3_9GAMM|nr:protein-disulfide reductase DsbD [Lysobacter selenitireducens]MBZ4040579.1 protein-disulfide reductase DsbD [Lysobacter selenitireducens]